MGLPKPNLTHSGWLNVAAIVEAAGAARLPLDEWAAKYRIVTQGAHQGPWRARTVPMVIEPMRAASDRRVSQITVVRAGPAHEVGFLRQPDGMGGAERRRRAVLGARP